MKKQFLLTLLVFGLLSANSQDQKYITAMKNVISIVDTCEGKASFNLARDKFSHISSQKKDDWLPYYYMAFCDVHIAMLQKEADSIEYYADKADVSLRAADSLSKNNTEIYCIKALNTIAKINVNYMSRALAYSSKATNILDEAEKIDAQNPRIYYLQGRFLYGRPKQFGGGKKVAMPYFEKAVNIYKTKPDDGSIYPHWGKRLSTYLLDVCSKGDD